MFRPFRRSRLAFFAASSLLLAAPAFAQKTQLAQNEFLKTSEYLVSPGRTAYAIMQGDGNLCIYPGSGPPNRTGSSWCNMVTGPIGDYFLMMQTDGNLVVYRGTGPADNKGYLWGTQKTDPGGKFFLKLYDDGNLAVHQGTPENLQVTIWQTGKNAPGTPVART